MTILMKPLWFDKPLSNKCTVSLLAWINRR